MNERTMMLPLLVILLEACGTEPLEGHESAGGGAPSGAVIDSVMPIPIALESFRAGISAAPEGLRQAASSPEALLEQVVQFLAASDTAAFERISLDRAEFAYLYYESSPLSHPPYELPPELMWFQLQQTNRMGVFRLLREFGGQELGEVELLCPGEPSSEGENRIWAGCRVRIGSGSKEREARMFGALIEREGRFKVLSYANDF